MSLDSVVSLVITTLTSSISRAGFGTPLLAAYHTVFPERVRTYTSLTGMTDDGFAATDPAYLMAVALKAQSPSPSSWKIGRKALPSQQTFSITPNSTVEDEVVRLTVEGTEITYTIPAAATVNSIATALQPLINAITGVTAVDSTGYVTVTPTTSNDLLSIGSPSLVDVKDNTPDPGIATDLAAIVAEDNDWYGLALDSESEAEINAAAVWVEANKKLFPASCIDTEIKDSGTSTDVGSDLQTAGYDRTGLLFTEINQQYGGARWMGKMFPKDPGSATWAFKDLAGLNVSVMSATEEATLDSKTVNHFQTLQGARVTRYGKVASGEFFDIIRGVDWFGARLQERIYSLFINNEKLPFSDVTGDLIRAEIYAQMGEAVQKGVLLPDAAATPWVIDIPLAANVAVADKANRLWPNIEFSAKLAGAVHKVTMQGTLSL